MSATICERCHRGLKDPDSVRAGLGPVCRAKSGIVGGDVGGKGDGRTVAELPFDPESMDIVCRRVPTGENDVAGRPMTRPVFNISQSVVWHSPTGFEWGYGGSGPADFALNVLCLFVQPGSDGCEPQKVFDGVCSRTAQALHQAFKSRFIAALPHEGGVIRGADVRAWIADQKMTLKQVADEAAMEAELRQLDAE